MQNSAQHAILFLSIGSYCAINVGNGFSSRPHGSPPCVCCVTGLTGQPTYGNGVPKKIILKQNGVFHTDRENSIKSYIEEF
jgi:hypothetical protein